MSWLRLKLFLPIQRRCTKLPIPSLRLYQSTTPSVPIIPRNTRACQNLIEECARESRPQEAEDVLREMLRYELKPDVISYTSVINSYAEAHLSDDAARVHKEMIDSGLDPNVVSYTSVMKAYGRKGQPQESERVFQEMLSRGIMPNIICFSALAQAFASSSLPAEAERILRSSQNDFHLPPSRLVYHPVIGGYNLVSQPQEGERLFHEMVSLGLANDDTVAMVIDSYANDRNLSDAERIYHFSLSHAIPPSNVTSNSLLKALSKSRLPERAEELLKSMIALNQSDVISFNTVMMAYLNASEPLQSERIFSQLLLTTPGVTPSVVTHHILMTGYLQRKDLKKFYQQFDSMTSSGLSLQTEPAHHLLRLLSRQTSADETERFLHTLETVSPGSVDLFAYHIVIQNFARQLKPDHGYELLTKVLVTRSGRPNLGDRAVLLSIFNSLIHSFCQLHRYSEAERLLQELQSRGILPDTYSYTTLISAYLHQISSSRDHRSSTSSSAHRPSSSPYNASKRVEELLNEIELRKLPYNEALYSILLRKLTQEARLSDMTALLERMESDGIPWDIYIYSQVMLAYGQAGDLERVERLYQALIGEAGLQPNKFIFQALIIASKRSGNQKRAEEWYAKAVTILKPAAEREKRKAVTAAATAAGETEAEVPENVMRADQSRSERRTVWSDISFLKKVLEREERMPSTLRQREKQEK
jgi:pentatricopeptide repeat protein